MHDPKFEKEVQQKLQELSFSPSDAVWANVDRAVNGGRKRRSPVFWFWTLPAAALTVAGIWFFAGRGTHNIPAASAPVKIAAAPAKAASTPAKDVSAPAKTASTPAKAASTPANDASAPTTAASTPATAASTPDRTASSTPAIAAPAPVTSSAVSTGRHLVPPPASAATIRTGIAPHTSQTPFANTSHTTQTPVNSASHTSPTSGADVLHTGNITSGPTRASSSVTASSPATASATASAHTGTVSLPALNGWDKQYAAPKAGRLTSRSIARSTTTATATTALAPIQLQPKYTWETGFGAGIGMSSLNKTLFEQPAAVLSDLRPNGIVINGAPKPFTSKIQPDLSYWAGIVAERQLNKRLTLALGLNFHYYSTRIDIGEKVVNPPQSSYYANQLISSGTPSQPTAAAYPYYPVGNTDKYTNRYYFMELPVSVLWQINHSRNLPLFWEGGASFAYLVSSNALHYNTQSSAFYKDGGKINRSQVNLATALLMGLPVKGMKLQAGPQIQYGLTSLQNDGATGQHLFYGGLRVILLPGKTKK